MEYRPLYFFIEGPDDQRFLENLIIPRLGDRYWPFFYIQYQAKRGRKKEDIIKYVHAINRMNANYFFIADINNSSCATIKKEKVNDIYKNRLSNNKIIIVIREIESWYYAGLEDARCDDLRIQKVSTTDNLTKENFESLLPHNFTHLLFMIEIIKNYSLDCAVNKNRSLQYFITKITT
jgi:hypothetical protein